MDMTRRSFLTGMLAVAAIAQLPALALAGVPTLWGDGMHDDTEALQALFDGKAVIRDGMLMEPAPGSRVMLSGGQYLVSRTLHVRRAAATTTIGGHFRKEGEDSGPVFHVHASGPEAFPDVLVGCYLEAAGRVAAA